VPIEAALNVDLRQAEPSEHARLRNFYLERTSSALPLPSGKTLGDAMGDGRLLVVEADRQSPILAAAAIFDYAPRGWKTYVGELAGPCVTDALGGYGPLGVQRILLAARVLGYVALNSQVAAGASSTLTVVVKASNARSIANVVAAGFVQLEDRPEWMIYDEHEWHGSPVGTEWLYFVATDDTARQAFADLDGVGFFTGTISLSRTNKVTAQPETLNLRCRLGALQMARHDLAGIHAGAPAGLSPPPRDLLP